MIKDLSILSPPELLKWIKNPSNILTGTIILDKKLIYSNIFSGFELLHQELLESLVFTNIDILIGKELGYITEGQKKYASLLDNIRGKCYNISSRQIDLFPQIHMTSKSTLMRVWKARFIRDTLKQYRDLNIGKQCVITSPNIKIIKKLGVGGFGVVYLASDLDDNNSFAIKMTINMVNKEAIAHPYSNMKEAWDEINLLRPYISSLIERGICQNFCYMYDSFICNTCNFEGNPPKKGIPCAKMALELANGTFEEWSQTHYSEDEYNIALFQCMAGIHTSPKYYQLSNADINDLNILVLNCDEGDYWEYVIMGKSYYIPNRGNVFLINDYGIGFSYDLGLDVCNKLKISNGKTSNRTNIKNASFRPFIVVNDKFTTIKYNNVKSNLLVKMSKSNVYPIICKLENENYTRYSGSTIINNISNCMEYSATLTAEQIATLEKNGIPTDITNPLFFSNSEIVPYLNMFVDTQDIIRMFIGGLGQANKNQEHGVKQNLPVKLKTKLLPYMFPHAGAGSTLGAKHITDLGKFKPSEIMAGYFIKEFFGDMYSQKPSGNLIQRFVI